MDNPGTLTTQTKIKNGKSRDSENTNKDKEWTIQGL
jgi:hypothetical protein